MGFFVRRVLPGTRRDAARRTKLHRVVKTLAARVKSDGPLNELDAVGWVIRLAKRVEELHQLGVAHGALSAEAVLIAELPRASKGTLADVRKSPELPQYHCPERHAGAGISQADDTWAAVVTLYFIITGSLPFAGDLPADVKKRIDSAAPAPLAVYDVGDDELQGILDTYLARNISQRVVKITSFRQALEKWHPDPTVRELPPLDEADDSLGDTYDFEDDEDNIRTVLRDFSEVRKQLNQMKGPNDSPSPSPDDQSNAPDDDEDEIDTAVENGAALKAAKPGTPKRPPSPPRPKRGPPPRPKARGGAAAPAPPVRPSPPKTPPPPPTPAGAPAAPSGAPPASGGAKPFTPPPAPTPSTPPPQTPAGAAKPSGAPAAPSGAPTPSGAPAAPSGSPTPSGAPAAPPGSPTPSGAPAAPPGASGAPVAPSAAPTPAGAPSPLGAPKPAAAPTPADGVAPAPTPATPPEGATAPVAAVATAATPASAISSASPSDMPAPGPGAPGAANKAAEAVPAAPLPAGSPGPTSEVADDDTESDVATMVMDPGEADLSAAIQEALAAPKPAEAPPSATPAEGVAGSSDMGLGPGPPVAGSTDQAAAPTPADSGPGGAVVAEGAPGASPALAQSRDEAPVEPASEGTDLRKWLAFACIILVLVVASVIVLYLRRIGVITAF